MPQVKKTAHLTGHTGAVYSLENGISPNSVLSGSGDKMIAQWDIGDAIADKFAVKMPAIIYSSLVIAELNLLLVGTASGSLHVIDLITKSEIKNLKLNYGGIFTINYISKSQTIVLSSANGFIAILHAISFDLIKEIPVSKLKLRSVAINELADKAYVTDGIGDLHVLSLANLEIQHSFKAHSQSCNVVAIHPSGKWILTGGKDAYLNVYDIHTYELIKSIPAHNFAIYDICFLEGTNCFATASRDKTIKLWDVNNFDFLLRINKELNDGHVNSVNALYWNKELKRLVSAGDDRTIMIWEIN